MRQRLRAGLGWTWRPPSGVMDLVHHPRPGGSPCLALASEECPDQHDPVIAIAVEVAIGGNAVDRLRPRAVVDAEPEMAVEAQGDSVLGRGDRLDLTCAGCLRV